MCGVLSDGATEERKKVISLIDKAKRSVTYWKIIKILISKLRMCII